MKMYRTLMALTVAGLLFAAAPASAAPVTRSFDIRTTPGVHGGEAHTWGTARFGGGGAILNGRLNDVCPKDGLGAYLDIYFYFANGGSRHYREKDIGGCTDPNGIAYSYNVNGHAPVRSIRLILREEDANGNKVGEERWLLIDNPRV
jgi:hypothetical protein